MGTYTTFTRESCHVPSTVAHSPPRGGGTGWELSSKPGLEGLIASYLRAWQASQMKDLLGNRSLTVSKDARP